MTLKKEIIQQKIKLLSKKKEVNLKDKDTFVDNKTKSIQRLTEEITNIKKDIEHKRNLFKLLQPTTDEYLLKLNDTYLSEYIPNKNQIDKTLIYNELSVLKFISNVEDYYKLIQMFDIAMKEKAKGNTNNEIDQLRNDIKIKPENFQKEKIMNNSLYSTMKIDTKSGMNYDEIIKRTSQRIIDDLSSAETVSNYQNTSTNKKVMIVA